MRDGQGTTAAVRVNRIACRCAVQFMILRKRNFRSNAKLPGVKTGNRG
jgi:hypothetical protein